MLRMLTAIGLVAVCGQAVGAEVVRSQLDVVVTRDGVEQVYSDALVPMLPDEACYYWYLQFDPQTKGPVSIVETLTLPEPLKAWQNYQNDPKAETQINADAQSAVTTLQSTPDADGWVSHGWCVAEGDPLGAHRFDVQIDGKTAQSWDFTVVAPAEFPFVASPPPETTPAAPPELFEPTNTARDVNQSW
jgi:hypothetical protein